MEAVVRAIDEKVVPKPTRVLMVAPPSSGGLARHVISLLDGLSEDGYEVGVACEADSLIAEVARARSTPVYGVSVGGRGPSGTLVSVVQVARAVGALHAQIIHTHSLRAGLVGALVMPGAPGAKLVATIHNFPPGGATMQARRSRERWAVRMLLRRADRLVTVSEALRGELIALRSEVAAKTVTIPNGVDISAEATDQSSARAALELPPEGPVVGMVARLAPAKGIAEFIQCCKLVSEQWPAARFVLAGGGPLWEEAQARREALGLADRLQLVGEVESTREVMGAVDVLVVASTSEGSSVVAMEAMACGKPVVATRVGGLPEVVLDGETGILVEAGDPRGLAEGIERLLQDPELGRQMGMRGKQRARQCYDVREMVARVKEVYADLLWARAPTDQSGRPGGGAREREEMNGTGGRR